MSEKFLAPQTQGNSSEKKAEIKVTTFSEYLQLLAKNPVEDDNLNAEERAEKNEEKCRAIEAKLNAANSQEHAKKYMEAGLLEEEIGYFPEDIIQNHENSGKLIQCYSENTKAGYFVELVPIYNENFESTGTKLFRTKLETVEEKAPIKAQIDLETLERENHSWFYEEQEKERQYQEKVRKGEMVYLGEITFDDYLKLTQDFRNTRLLEIIWVFDEEKNVTRESKKYYAYVGKPKS